MSVYYRTQGFVLKKIDLREADQVFVIYAEDFGKIEVLGRGIRKIKSKIKPGIDLFYLSEIDFVQGKKQKTLIGATAIEKFKNIRNSPEKLAIVYKIVNVADDLINGQEQDGGIWNLLREVFDKLNNSDFNVQSSMFKVIHYYFFWNLLSILGYKSDLYHCVFCGKKLMPQKNYFIPKSGIFCARCAGERKSSGLTNVGLSQDAIKILRILENKSWGTLIKLKMEKIHLTELEKIFQMVYSNQRLVLV